MTQSTVFCVLFQALTLPLCLTMQRDLREDTYPNVYTHTNSPLLSHTHSLHVCITILTQSMYVHTTYNTHSCTLRSIYISLHSLYVCTIHTHTHTHTHGVPQRCRGTHRSSAGLCRWAPGNRGHPTSTPTSLPSLTHTHTSRHR